jgi:hypothetical protein
MDDQLSPEGPDQPRTRDLDRPPVMSDVAELAGVSQMTVSRVINERSGVRDETRARVLAAMRELDYHPNIAARTRVTGRSKTLGVVSFNTTLYGPASTLYGVELAARTAGYFVSVATMRTLDRRSLQEAVGRLRTQGVRRDHPDRPTERRRRGPAAVRDQPAARGRRGRDRRRGTRRSGRPVRRRRPHDPPPALARPRHGVAHLGTQRLARSSCTPPCVEEHAARGRA